MAHHTVKSEYRKLVRRLNRFPLGAPPSALLFDILRMLFTEQEAGLVALLPLRPFDSQQAARIWKMPLLQTEQMLEKLAERMLLVDILQNGKTFYVLPPPMAGFFEFSLMRVRGDLDQQLLSELFYQYLNVEDDFIRDLFTGRDIQLGRIFVQEGALPADPTLEVLDYERASQIIQGASHLAVGLCYCRHKMQHVGRACQAPLEICLTCNTAAAALVRHGHARAIDAAEGLDLLQQARDLNLVQFGENAREGVNFICNCCKCCCEALLAARRFGMLQPVHTTNFFPRVKTDRCLGCGACQRVCPVDAIALTSPKEKGAATNSVHINDTLCLGCGLCAKICPSEAMYLVRRPQKTITPLNSTHRTILMALEKGKLQELIFDNQVLFSHRALAALLGVVLRLPPVKQTLVRNQLCSRYIERLSQQLNP